MSAPRVGLIIGQLHAGGSERQLFELARGLKRGACEPFVYCLSEIVEPFGSRLESEGVPVRVLPRRRSFEPRRIWALARWLRRDRIDVVSSFAQNMNVYAYLATLLARRGVLISSSRYVALLDSRPMRHLSSFIFRHSWRVVVNSAEGAAFVEKFNGVRPDCIEVIPNGIDTARFDGAALPEETRRSLGIPLAAPVAGIVGRLSPEKRVDLFLEAARETAARIPEARFLIVGGGSEMEAMQAMAARLLPDGATLTGSTEQVDAIMAALDLLVLTSDFEGLPNVVLEAMAAGRPVVATDVGACRTIVTDGITGFLAPPGDAPAIAARMIEVLSLPDRGRSMGAAGRAKVLQNFGLERMVRRFEALYLRAASRQAGALDAATPLS